MEHGPTSTSRRASRRARIRVMSRRELKMVAIAASDVGRSSSRKTGGRTTFVHLMRRSSVGCDMTIFLIGIFCDRRDHGPATATAQYEGGDPLRIYQPARRYPNPRGSS